MNERAIRQRVDELLGDANLDWLRRLGRRWPVKLDAVTASQIYEYVRRLQATAARVVAELESLGDETEWVDGDETDRVYPWYEIAPLKAAILNDQDPG